MKKRLFMLSFIALSCITMMAASCSTPSVGEFNLTSPNNVLKVTLDNTSGKMTYKLSKDGVQLFNDSEISILNDTSVTVKGVTKGSNSSTWKPTWGQFSQIEDRHKSLVLTLNIDGREAQLEVRLFDDGVGFRYKMDDYKASEKAELLMEYNTYVEDLFYWSGYGEGDLGPYTVEDMMKRDAKARFTMPLVVESSTNNYLAFLESDLFMTEGFKTINIKFNKSNAGFYSSNGVSDIDIEEFVTPWRVILVGEQAGDLTTNNTSLNLATECQLDDTSWIKPGLSLWDWRAHSHVAPDGFKYGIDTKSYFRFVDFAAKWDLDYFLIDDAWYDKVELGRIYPSSKLDLPAVIEYAKQKDVDLMLYYDRHRGYYGDEDLFKYYSSLNMKGIKYGFMGSEVEFTQQSVRESAAQKLMINFHDGPVPMTGLERTYPNAISREYCHGQQDSRRAFTPEMFIKMALVNAVHGPLDMSNGNFDLLEINSGVRAKGPRKTDSYFSTVVSEVARVIIINTGLAAIPDAPDCYDAKADLFELIAKTPIGKWDESVVVNSKFNQYITTARRHGSEWFVGTVVGRECDALDIETSFLESGKEYAVTYYVDGDDAHCLTNPESYCIEEGRIKGGETIKAKMAKGGGHAMLIREL
ncbi:MAG: glycoside hydrolase family 97 catalytic domain-containing protein [Rikenellaceae bacterium]